MKILFSILIVVMLGGCALFNAPGVWPTTTVILHAPKDLRDTLNSLNSPELNRAIERLRPRSRAGED